MTAPDSPCPAIRLGGDPEAVALAPARAPDLSCGSISLAQRLAVGRVGDSRRLNELAIAVEYPPLVTALVGGALAHLHIEYAELVLHVSDSDLGTISCRFHFIELAQDLSSSLLCGHEFGSDRERHSRSCTSVKNSEGH